MRVRDVGGFFVSGVPAPVDDKTRLTEVSSQYQMLRLDSIRKIPFFTANGTASLQNNLIDHLTAAAELEVAHNGNIHNIELEKTWRTYPFGSRVSFATSSPVAPAFERLLREVNVAGSIKSQLLPDIPGTRLTGRQNASARTSIVPASSCTLALRNNSVSSFQ